jgi:glyoxylate carboligase
MTHAAIQDLDADIVRTGIPAIEGEGSKRLFGRMSGVAIGLIHGVVLEIVRWFVMRSLLVRRYRGAPSVQEPRTSSSTGNPVTRLTTAGPTGTKLIRRRPGLDDI